MVVLLVVMTAILFLSIEMVYVYRSKKRESLTLPAVEPATGPMVEAATKLLGPIDEPEGLFYNPSHSWAFLEIDGKVKIGLDHFFQRVFGKVEKIEVPEPGKDLEQGSPFLVVQSGERRLKARIPVGGKIEEVNQEVINDPEILIRDSYRDGWILRMKPDNFLESTRSLIFGKYAKKWLSGEINRLRDFLVKNVSKEDVALQTMYDGGIPVHGVSGLIDDKLWAALKKEFFGDEG